MIAFGIDPGTSCGVAAVTETEVAWTTLTLPSWRHHVWGAGFGHANCQRVIAQALREIADLLLPYWNPGVAAVEDSQHAASMRAAAVQAEHFALASLACDGEAHRVAPVHPAAWQHGIVGALGRDEYVRYAVELTGGALDPRNHDAAAAICIAEWAWHNAKKQA